MAAVVRVHRPALSQEERDRKMAEIKKATMDFHKKTRHKEKEHG